MDKIMYLLAGGFLKGYRTALIAVGTVVSAVFIPWAVGDVSLIEAVKANWEIVALALGIGAAAKH